MIIQLDEAKRTLGELRQVVNDLASALRIDTLKNEIAEMEERTSQPDFWNDQENSGKILQSIKIKKDKIEAYERLQQRLEDAYLLAEMGIEENDESVVEEVLEEVEAVKHEAERQRIDTLLSGQYDRNNAILSFHPGAGGTEAQDWASMLYRMYVRFGEKNGFKVKLLDWLDGENGVHRLVRISPFDASGRRHTSFASVEVMPEFSDEDCKIELRDEDLEITAHRSSGAGGQHINKTDSAIRIVHIPTGIVVGCQTERSQLQNKETALKMLKSKLMEIKEREKLERIEDIQGNKTNIEWGAQIRSYVFMPYTLVKDTRTGYEEVNIGAVMDGEIDGFINAYLKMKA